MATTSSCVTYRGRGPLGNYLRVREDTLSFMSEVLAECGDFARFRVLTLPYYLVNEPSLVRQALVENSEGLVIQGGVSRGLARLIGHGILTNRGDAWRASRSRLQPLFHQAALTSYLPTIAERVEESFARWRERYPSEPFSLYRELLALSYRIAGSTLFRHLPSFEESEQFADAVSTLQREGMHRFMNGGDLFPWLPFPLHRRVNHAVRVLRQLAERAVEQGAGQPVDEILSLLFAGTESPVTTLCFALELLEDHPRWAEALRTELRGVSSPEGFDRSGLLGQVLSEALRLYPAGWAFERYARVDVQLGDERVRKGARLLFSPFHLHRNPRLWREPAAFSPERFAANLMAPEGVPKYAYLPFGAGPRSCIGSRHALMQMRITLGMLLTRCHWQLERPAGDAALRPEGSFKLRLHRPLRARVEVDPPGRVGRTALSS